jgi:hypothetical protein
MASAEEKPKKIFRTPQGITLGVNLAGPINKAFDNDRTGLSFISRVNIAKDYFLIGEVGYENISFKREHANYTSNGTFLKVGAEIDVMKKKEEWSNDNLMLGLHYGIGVQEHGASQFVIKNGYWNDYEGRVPSYFISTQWLEFSIGPRTEVFKNFYMAWNIHLRLAVLRDNSADLKPYIIPGFGNGDNRFNAAFSYTLEYMIPWKK